MIKIILLFMVFSMLLLTLMVQAVPSQRLESFDSDPGWEGNGNRDDPQDFGFSAATNNAAGVSGVGEAGGILVRTTQAWYAR
jgi:hypothetical protein